MVADYIRQNDRRHSAHCAIYEASRAVNPLPLDELEAVVDLWADAALRLTDGDLKRMERLVAAQTRLREKAGNSQSAWQGRPCPRSYWCAPKSRTTSSSGIGAASR